MSNTSQFFFGVNAPQTAEYVSTRLGEATIVVASGDVTSGTSSQTQETNYSVSHSRSAGDSENYAPTARKLLKPEEVLALDERTCVTFVPACPPILTRLERYYERGPGFWRRLASAGGANDSTGNPEEGEMSARDILNSLKDVAVESIKDAPAEIGAELKRLGVQGAMEIASVAFTGQGFVPYGPGQYPKDQGAPEIAAPPTPKVEMDGPEL